MACSLAVRALCPLCCYADPWSPPGSPTPPAGCAVRPARAMRARTASRRFIWAVRPIRSADRRRMAWTALPHTGWRYRPDGAWRARVLGGQRQLSLHTRPECGSVPTAPGTDTPWGNTLPPRTVYTGGGGNSARQRSPPGRGKLLTARPILVLSLLFIYSPPGPHRPQHPAVGKSLAPNPGTQRRWYPMLMK